MMCSCHQSALPGLEQEQKQTTVVIEAVLHLEKTCFNFSTVGSCLWLGKRRQLDMECPFFKVSMRLLGFFCPGAFMASLQFTV